MNKKLLKKLFVLIFVGMTFVACNHEPGNSKDDKAVLKIEIADNFRTVLPKFQISDISEIKLYKTSVSSENQIGSWNSYDDLSGAEVEVDEGEYSFVLQAKIKGTSFSDTQKIVINKGSNTVLFSLSVLDYGTGTGELSIQVNYPKINDDKIIVSLVDCNGNSVETSLNTEKLTGTEICSSLKITGSSIPVGEYNVELVVLTSDAQKKVSYSDKVIIASGATSEGTYDCTDFVLNGRLFELGDYLLTDFAPVLDNVVKGDVLTFSFEGISLKKSEGIIAFGIKSEDKNLNSTETEICQLGEKYSDFSASKTYEIAETAKSNNPRDYKVYFKSKGTDLTAQFVAAVKVTQNVTGRQNPISITFDCNGGKLSSEKSVYAGKNIEISAVKEGFAFMGWYDSDDNKVLVIPSTATKLKAKWYDLNKITNSVEETYTDIQLLNCAKYSYWTNDGLEESLEYSTFSETLILKSKVAQDFSITVSDQIKVNKGEKYLLTADLYRDSDVYFAINFVTRKDENPSDAVSWTNGTVSLNSIGEYETVSSLYEIPDGIDNIQINIPGNGIGSYKLKNISLKKIGYKESDSQKAVVSIENNTLKIECDVKTASVTVTDLRNNKSYSQVTDEKIHWNIDSTKTKASVLDGLITLKCFDWSGKEYVVLSVGFNPFDEATVDYSVYGSASSELKDRISFPHKSVTKTDDYMVIPFNEGMAIDYNDFTTLASGDGNWSWYDSGLLFSQGNWISMPFFGVTNKKDGTGFISIIKDPDDCYLSFAKGTTNSLGAIWEGQKGKFGYTRHLSQTFFTEGGHVAIAKKYREYAKDIGLLVTFDQKKQQRGAVGTANIEKLAGAANIWRTEYDSASNMEQELKDAGMDRLMLSHQVWTNTENLKPVDSLITRYDIYQDAFSVEDADSCWTCPDVPWISKKGVYPNEIIVRADGSLDPAWVYQSKTGEDKQTYSVCDLKIVDYARMKIPEELKTLPYNGRFFDTTTTGVKECYSTDHPMTRTDSKKARYDLLAVSSIDNKLVTGSETGADFVVPVCDYFEGMMSLAKFRDADAGGVLGSEKDNVPDYMLGVQLNEKLRLPLWELVYHDCCVAYWYWGDSNTLYNNDTIYDKRDDFNALYAVPPLYWVTSSESFQNNKARIVKSYKKSAYITRNAFGVEMINHEYLTEDRSKQRTTFANGLQVTVDFNSNTITY